MSKGQFGSSDGGHKNGIKNAIAEVAKNKTQDLQMTLVKRSAGLKSI